MNRSRSYNNNNFNSSIGRSSRFRIDNNNIRVINNEVIWLNLIKKVVKIIKIIIFH